MSELIFALTDAIQSSAPARMLQVSKWLYPIINAAHILSLALLFGSIAVVDIAILKRGAYTPKNDGKIVCLAIIGFVGVISPT